MHRIRQTAIHHEWEHILDLTKEGVIRTAFSRNWARKRYAKLKERFELDHEVPIDNFETMRFLEIFQLALKQSINALDIIQEANADSSFISLWQDEKQYLEVFLLFEGVTVSSMCSDMTVAEVSQGDVVSGGSAMMVTTGRDTNEDPSQQGKLSASAGDATATDADLSVVPRVLQCSICLNIFNDPVKTVNGFIYDRNCIKEWFQDSTPSTKPPIKEQGTTEGIKDVDEPEPQIKLLIEPKTGEPLYSEVLTTDGDMKAAVAEFRMRQQEFVDITSSAIKSSSFSTYAEKVKELVEKRDIMSSSAVLQYYVTMQLAINAFLKTCAIILFDIRTNKRDSFDNYIAKAIDTYDEIKIAYLGLDIFRELFSGEKNRFDDQSKIVEIEQLSSIFSTDPTFISVVAERVARGMAIYRKKELEKELGSEKAQTYVQEKSSLRTAVEACLNITETCHSKVRAIIAVNIMLKALMKRELVVNTEGLNTMAKVEAITRAIVGCITDVEPPCWVQTPLVFADAVAKPRSSTNNKRGAGDKSNIGMDGSPSPNKQPTPNTFSDGISSEMQIEPPVLRQTPFVVTRSVAKPPVEGAFIMVDKHQSSLFEVEIWQQTKSRRLIRLEYDSEKKLRQVMSANFIFITLTDSLDSDTTGLRETIQNKVNSLAGDIGEGGIWIEKSASLSRLCALHFASPKIKFFDSILQVAVEMKLKPFPNYCKLCSPRYLKSGPSFDSAAWNNDLSTFRLGKPSAPRIKIGIIDPHFSQHDNLIFSNVIEQGDLVDDHNRGTHVAGIIGAMKSTDNSVAMRGVCSPDNVELFAYALCSARVPNHYIGIHIIALINALLRCSEDSVDLVDLSMQWCCQYSRDELAFVINMRDAIVTEIAINNKFHVVIAAGDDSRNLEVYQLNSVINTGDPEVWVDLFSSIASCIRNRFTIVGASDIFGQLASFSNYGTTRDVAGGIVGTIVDLVAPGERILSTEYSPNGYHVRDGTFHAAPLIAGAMALIKFNSPTMSFTEIVSMLKATVDVNFTLVGKCISGGRLNLDRALGDPENALSTEERDHAYPLRDEAFVVGGGVSNIIGNHMTSQDLLAWYASEDGKLLEKKVSCMLLFLAIDHLRAVDANEFPMLLNFENRARIRESLTMRIPVPVPQRNSGQWGQLVEAIQSLQNSLAINPPELFPPDNRVTATRREWEAIFRLTMEGTIRTAFLRDWVRKKQEPTGVMQELIFVEALKVSSTAIAAIQALNLQSQQFLQMWWNEEKYIFDAMSAKAFYVRCERVKIFVAGLSIRELLDWYYSDHGQAFVKKLSCMFWAQAIDLLRAVDEEDFNYYSNNNRSALLQGLEDAIPEPPPEIVDFSDLVDSFQVHANNFLARTATPLERFPPSIDWMTATRRKWIETLRHTKAGKLPTAFLIECAEIRQAGIRQETRNLRLNREIVVTGVQKQSLIDTYDDYDILFQCALHETAVAINYYQQHPDDGGSSSFLSLWLRWENWLTIQLEEVSEMREWLSDINTVV